MTGDNIQNDLVVRPALTHWPLIVLLNDGHNHFTVAISATLPSAMDSGSRLSRSQQVPDGAVLVSFASKAGTSASDRQFLVPSFSKASSLRSRKVRRIRRIVSPSRDERLPQKSKDAVQREKKSMVSARRRVSRGREGYAHADYPDSVTLAANWRLGL